MLLVPGGSRSGRVLLDKAIGCVMLLFGALLLYALMLYFFTGTGWTHDGCMGIGPFR